MSDDRILSVREAAEVLGISPQRVRQMISSGRIEAVRSSAGWLVSANILARRSETVATGRPPAPRTTWAMIHLLATAWVPDACHSEGEAVARRLRAVGDRRLRHRAIRILDDLPDPAEDITPWLRLLRSRGRVRRLWVHPGLLDRLASDPHVSVGGDRSAAPTHDGISQREAQIALYVSAENADIVVQHFRMRDDKEGNVTLIVVPSSVSAPLAPTPNRPVPAPAAAADLLDEDDVRAQGAAIELLQMFHTSFRETRRTEANSVATSFEDELLSCG